MLHWSLVNQTREVNAMMEPASHTVTASGEVNGSRNVYGIVNRIDSTELLRQLSDVVDSFARLSTPPESPSVCTRNGSSWSLLDHAHKLLSVTGALRETPERALSQ